MTLDLTHRKPERAEATAVTLAGNHPSSPLPSCLRSRAGEGKRSSETERKAYSQRERHRTSSARAPALLYYNRSLPPYPGSAYDVEVTGYSQGEKHLNAFIILRKKKKERKNQKHTPLWELREEMPRPGPLPSPLRTHLGSLLCSAAQRPQGLEALGDTEEGVSSG